MFDNRVRQLMSDRFRVPCAIVFLLLLQGCSHTNLRSALRPDVPATDSQPKMLAVYEPWFGHPQHLSVGYSSHDPVELRKQVDEAKVLGISGFVVDWYGSREPFIDESYALLQTACAEKQFKIAMMYDETDGEDGNATDDTIAALYEFRDRYLAANAAGRDAYLTYNGRPLIFIFPKQGHTDWNKVRTEINKWKPAPLLIYENQSAQYADAMDGFYAWINPGKKGWAPDGSNWGGDYLQDFYHTMQSKYPDKIAIGAAWAGFDDSKAPWGLNRHMSQRCGQTLTDTLSLARQYSAEHSLPFVVIATWNDYEEGTAIERGLAKCKADPQTVAQE
jgi:hypothetical protein